MVCACARATETVFSEMSTSATSTWSAHKILLGLCFSLFAIQSYVGPERVFERFAIWGPAVFDGQWWRAVSGSLLHANVTHLLMNMLALWVLGRLIEADLDTGGRWRFPVLVLASMLGAVVGVLLLSFDSPTVGLSGVVFGLLAAGVAIPRRVGLSWNHYNLVPWLVFNLVFTFAVPGISVGGHMGGLLAGFVAAWFLVPPQLQALAQDHRPDPR